MLIVLPFVLGTCMRMPSLRTQVETLGTLRVALVPSATTYYRNEDGPAGFEYDLVHHFAQHLGLQLEIIPVPGQRAAIDAVRSGKAHMAAGMAITPAGHNAVRFTPPYARIQLDVIYNTDSDRPGKLADLDAHITIPADTMLDRQLLRQHPKLSFSTREDTTSQALLALVAEGKLRSTIADSNLVAVNQRYHPNLRVAFTLDGIQRRLAWAFPAHSGNGLYNQAIAWLVQARSGDIINNLRQRYFGHAKRLGFVGGRIFAQKVRTTLPKWKDIFRQVGRKYDIDWRLLAALSYQESHWNPRATSPTGVRGLMMLTQATASELGLSDRLNPRQSISGGARYFLEQLDRLPESIKEPDRTWLALAAYNIGLGHLMDARRLLAARGLNPDLWVNVRKALPWLTRKAYVQHTRHGYAPGRQAVDYVGNIRAYYDLLQWLSQGPQGDPRSLLARTTAPTKSSATLRQPRLLAIMSPAL